MTLCAFGEVEDECWLSFLLKAALLTCLKTAELLFLMFKWGCQKGTNRAADKVSREDRVPLPPLSSQAGRGAHQCALLGDLTFRAVCCRSCKRLQTFFQLQAFFKNCGLRLASVWFSDFFKGGVTLSLVLLHFQQVLMWTVVRLRCLGFFLFPPHAKALVLLYGAACVAVGVKEASQI